MGKYKKIADLYVTGKEVVFKDGSVMWMQVANEFEKADCRRAAQAERGKLVMALREIATPEWDQMQGNFYAQTPALTISEICNTRLGEWYVKVQEAIENEPDWREKIEILKRSDEATAMPKEPVEVELHGRLNAEYVAEVTSRLDEERAYYTRELEKLSEEELLAEFKERWIDRRGANAAMTEYALWELYLGARECEGRPVGDVYDHTGCNHNKRAFDDPQEVRSLPDEVKKLMRTALEECVMSEREAKNSDRSLSSSVQSQGPEQQEDSTPSIPEEVELQPLGS